MSDHQEILKQLFPHSPLWVKTLRKYIKSIESERDRLTKENIALKAEVEEANKNTDHWQHEANAIGLDRAHWKKEAERFQSLALGAQSWVESREHDSLCFEREQNGYRLRCQCGIDEALKLFDEKCGTININSEPCTCPNCIGSPNVSAGSHQCSEGHKSVFACDCLCSCGSKETLFCPLHNFDKPEKCKGHGFSGGIHEGFCCSSAVTSAPSNEVKKKITDICNKCYSSPTLQKNLESYLYELVKLAQGVKVE